MTTSHLPQRFDFPANAIRSDACAVIAILMSKKPMRRRSEINMFFFFFVISQMKLIKF